MTERKPTSNPDFESSCGQSSNPGREIVNPNLDFMRYSDLIMLHSKDYAINSIFQYVHADLSVCLVVLAPTPQVQWSIENGSCSPSQQPSYTSKA